MTTHDAIAQLSPAKRAVYEIRQLRSRVEELERLRTEPIAIVGLGCRFPQAGDPGAFWELLKRGGDAVREVPGERWSLEEYYDADADAPGKMSTRWGGFLEGVDGFDAEFFGISPREAMSMDPQQRLLLEVAWEALENAAVNPLALTKSNAGVFLALSNSDYNRLAFEDKKEIDTYTATGNVFSVAAGRVSYVLGIQGPNVAIDTACSGSLVAVHLACQSLRMNECRMALAGGVNLILTPEISVNLSKAHMMAGDGRCKTFDWRADGFVRGEGCGVVVLKRQREAEADGDRILALIRGSAVNQDGRSGGLTVPSGSAQQAVIRQGLAAAGIEPEEVGYVEAHGTGTSLGDPIEAHALAAVLGKNRSVENPLVVGSVKTNIGHLEAAAGVAGLIKAVLALEREEIPPHLHFEKLNPHIDWGGMAVEIPLAVRPWRRGSKPRVAAVSAFGFSGTNAHVVVEEAPEQQPVEREMERPLHLLGLSARSPEALGDLVRRYGEVLGSSGSKVELGDLCHTANAGRAHFEYRLTAVGSTAEQVRAGLQAGLPGQRVVERDGVRAVFLFSGQGTQYGGMGKELYQTQPVFRQGLEECATGLAGQMEVPLLELLWGVAADRLGQTEYTQPALFAVEYALARLWQSWGIEPAAVLGHSVGEYVAACIAGVYSLEDGLRLIAARGRLMQGVSGRGGMLAVRGSEAQAQAALAGLEQGVRLAAVNGPGSVVVAGYEAELGEVEKRLQAGGVAVQRLKVSHGFHSPQMAEMEEAFEQVAAGVKFRIPQVEMISSWTGQAARGGELGQASYWREQVRRPVRFQAAMEALRGYRVFVEVGPGTTLTRLGRQNLPDAERLWVSSIGPGSGEWETMLKSLGQLYVAGAEVDWKGFDAPYHRRKLDLPTYPFQRQRYWIDTKSKTIPNPQNTGSASWETVCEAAAHQSACAGFDLDVGAYPARWNALDRLSEAFIRETLVELGAFQAPSESQNPHSLTVRYGLEASYERLMGRWLNRLAGSGWLLREGDCFTAVKPLARPDIAHVRAEVEAVHGTDRVFLDYVLRCGKNLTKILTGRMSALATIFPDGDFTLAEDLYERAPVAAYFRDLCRAALEGFVRGRRPGTYRVLEIGAGTGSTASALLPVLPAETSEYNFTDVSDIFLNRARQKFAAYPFVRYGRLDMELDPAAQGYPGGDFDVVVATNVLHATRDIRATLGRVKSLLAPGGILILCEATTHFGWFDVSTGLIEGWQVFEDGLRGEHPLLAPEAWQAALLKCGFEAVSVFPPAGSRAEALAQRVLVAKAPGDSVARHGAIRVETEHATVPVTEAAAVLTALLEARPLQRHDSLVTLMRQHLAEILRFPSPDQIDRKRRLTDLGLDSLMSLEFSSRLTKALHLEKPLGSTLVFDYPTLDVLAEYLENDVLHFPATPEVSGTTARANDARLEEIERLPDEEVEALLLKKLKTL